MNEGYIKSYRSILENPVVCKDTDYFSVWNYLLLNATHKEQKAVFNGNSIFLKQGQLIVGRKKIAEFWNISESKVQRILKFFEIEQQIEQQTSNKNRLITILNWDKYQSSEQQTEQQVNNNRTTSEQQMNTNKNVKNDKNVKNERNNTRSAKTPKHKHGKYNNVLLTDEEVEKLKAQLPQFDKNLETFSERLEMKNYKYKSHYLAMLNWFKDEKPKTTSYDVEKIKKRVNNFD